MKVGMTFGVWDVLHYGHIKFLESAKRFVDILIVGVCSDELNDKLKGKARFNEETRKEYLKQLKSVDEVFIYQTTDYLDYFKNYGANILIVGADFGTTKEHRKALCGVKEIMRISRTPEISSTMIRGFVNSDRFEGVRDNSRAERAS